MMLYALAIDMLERFSNDLLHQLGGELQIHPAFLNTGNGQEVFHKIDKPHGIVINVRINLRLRFRVKACAV